MKSRAGRAEERLRHAIEAAVDEVAGVGRIDWTRAREQELEEVEITETSALWLEMERREG